MTIQSGSLVLLKIGHGTVPEKFVTIGGMRTTRFLLNNQLIDASHKESGQWRHLLSGAGISSLSISGNGIFTNSIAETILRHKAFTNQSANFCLCFGNGHTLVGLFLISAYERFGSYGEEENYSLALESGGEVVYRTPSDNLAKIGL